MAKLICTNYKCPLPRILNMWDEVSKHNHGLIKFPEY